MIHSNSWPHLQCHLSENKYTTFWLFFFLFPAGTFMCTQHIHTLAHAHNLNFKHNRHNKISIDFEYGSQFKAVVGAFVVRDQYNTYSKYTVIRFRERIGAA